MTEKLYLPITEKHCFRCIVVDTLSLLALIKQVSISQARCRMLLLYI